MTSEAVALQAPKIFRVLKEGSPYRMTGELPLVALASLIEVEHRRRYGFEADR